MNKPSVWPDWLDSVWAKSPSKDDKEGETLSSHTWQVLLRLADLTRLRPDLPAQVVEPRLWHRLFWACLCHDLGKCAQGFQDRLRGQTGTPAAQQWGKHRHEVLSIPFVAWVFPFVQNGNPIARADQMWIIAAIVSHHRDCSVVQTLYPDEDAELGGILSTLPAESLHGIFRWLSECPKEWAASLDIPSIEFPVLLDERTAVQSIAERGAETIHRALRDYGQWVTELGDDDRATIPEILMRGLVMQADHTASAYAGEIRQLRLKASDLRQRWTWINALKRHQEECESTSGSALLTAPTGSGKTEAALLWACKQSEQPGAVARLFYTLPYQASMNAMWTRLTADLGDQVGMEHGRGLLALYRLMMDKDNPDPATIAKRARWRRNLARLHHLSVRIFSPYQMLKAAYRLKGYESMLADFHNAVFVFDEIHAYEASRLALIIEMMRHLTEHYNARFLVMSATFPQLIKDRLQAVLGSPKSISADAQLYREYCRHRIQLLQGDMFDETNWSRVRETARRGQSILLCCNTVQRAQDAYRLLVQQLPSVEVVLLHSRFINRDRLVKERIVQDATGSKSDVRRPIILVATQVVEVSLDIDLDTIFTDPAPLEALVQRFGRINRRRLQQVPALVHVFDQPDDGQGIYLPSILQQSLRILDRENGNLIDESAIGSWLNEIYVGVIRLQWEAEYSESAETFARVLRHLRPFESSEELEDQFYRAFDGMEVLPAQFETNYLNALEQNPITAGEFLVPISMGRYFQLREAGLIESRIEHGPLIADVPYDQDIGLIFDGLH